MVREFKEFKELREESVCALPKLLNLSKLPNVRALLYESFSVVSQARVSMPSA